MAPQSLRSTSSREGRGGEGSQAALTLTPSWPRGTSSELKAAEQGWSQRSRSVPGGPLWTGAPAVPPKDKTPSPLAQPGVPLTRPLYSSSSRPSIHFSVSRRRCNSRRSYLTVTRAWRLWMPGLAVLSARLPPGERPGERAGDARPKRLPTRSAAIVRCAN